MKKKLLVVMSVLALVSVVAVFGTIGITTAFAASNARDSDKAPWTEEQLAEFQAEMEDRLTQDLADGKITQEQFDAILSGEMPRFGGMPFMPKPGAPKGERFELTDEQKAEMQELLLQDLENGKITQEQYDAILNGEMPKFGGVPFMPNPDCFKGEKPERPELTDGQRPEPEERFAQDFDFPQGMIPPGGKMGNKPVPPGNMKR